MHLERNLICSAIPEVYDIFVFADEVRFSMEWIEGIDSLKFLAGEAELEKTFVNILLQICFILEILGRELKFDHRDLKPENIWIRHLSVPANYVISIDGIAYRIEFSHQVILLDFGFACIGSTIPPMSLAQDVIPAIDPCPKTGRDMYHILSRFLNESAITKRLSKQLYEAILEWMKPYRVKNGGLLYLITADAHFENRRLKPGVIIKWFLDGVSRS
jgi:serine/threonine protein kinase